MNDAAAGPARPRRAIVADPDSEPAEHGAGGITGSVARRAAGIPRQSDAL